MRNILWASACLLLCACREPAHPGQWAAPNASNSRGAEQERKTPASEAKSSADFWTLPNPTPFAAESLAKVPARVLVEGNHFIDRPGHAIAFRGVSIADPELLQKQGHLDAELFRTIHEWGANVVRVPVHPAAFRALGQEAYFNLLDQTVRLASGFDLYVIIDWHSIGNLRTGLFQHPMYDTSLKETFEFWRSVSFRYANVPTVAFFELFNEPTVYGGTLGAITWAEWRAINEELIDVIRAHKSDAIPLVSGFNWAYELESVVSDPVRRPSVGYVSHPYPMKTTRPFEPNWEKSFGHVATKYPLIATEIGFAPAGSKGAHEPVIDDGPYASEVTAYLEGKGASWVAWVFHPEWAPQLIENWSYQPTVSGEAFRKLLQGSKAKASN